MTDTWKLAAHHRLLSYRQGNNCTILSFAGILAKQLLILSKMLDEKETLTIDKLDAQSISDMSNETRSLSTTGKKRE